MVMVIRSAGLRISAELGPPDLRLVQFLWEIGELAAHGEDIRDRVFMPRASEDPTH